MYLFAVLNLLLATRCMTSVATSPAFDKLSMLLSYTSTHCDIFIPNENGESHISSSCPKDKSCHNFQGKSAEHTCKSVSSDRYSVLKISGFSYTNKTTYSMITIDSYENYDKALWSLVKKNQDNIYIEFVLKFEGLNTIHKYELSSRAAQVIYVCYIKNKLVILQSHLQKS